jgi:hypothetical protein
MDQSWKKVDDSKYILETSSFIFTLELATHGVHSRGRAYIFWARNVKDIINTALAAFFTIDDCTHSYLLRSVDSKLWNSIEEIQERTSTLVHELNYSLPEGQEGFLEKTWSKLKNNLGQLSNLKKVINQKINP